MPFVLSYLINSQLRTTQAIVFNRAYQLNGDPIGRSNKLKKAADGKNRRPLEISKNEIRLNCKPPERP